MRFVETALYGQAGGTEVGRRNTLSHQEGEFGYSEKRSIRATLLKTEAGACSKNVTGASSMDRLLENLMDKLTDPHWLLIGGIAIGVIALIVVGFPQRPK
jgi:hypothetical protein